jgi:outer membrane protein
VNTGPRTWHQRFRARFGLGLVLVASISASISAQEARIAYVDMQRLLDNAPQILRARDRLTREFTGRDQALNLDVARLSELQARLERESSLPADERDDALPRQTEALRRSVERTRQRLRDELSARQDEEIERAWPQINEAIAGYARDEGYDLVLQSPVVYVSGRIDITERVLDRLNRELDDSESRP